MTEDIVKYICKFIDKNKDVNIDIQELGKLEEYDTTEGISHYLIKERNTTSLLEKSSGIEVINNEC